VIDKQGDITASIRLIGVFVVRDGRIIEWRDCFDPSAFKPA